MAYPVTLNGRTYTLADFEGTNYVDGLPDAFEDFVTHAGNTYQTTSTTSIALGTGTLVFTVADSGKPYASGTPLRISNQADETDYIDALVTTYSGTTLTVNAVGYSGTGTIAAWNINIGGGPITVAGTLPISQGGTGATTAAAAATALGLGTGDTPTFAGLNVTGTANFGDVNITNVGDIALDTISSDAGTSVTVSLGSDAGDDFIVGSNYLVVEGDTGNVGVGTSSPATATGGGIDIERAGGASVRLDDTTNTVTGELQVYSSGMNLATVTNHNMLFSTNNSERMRIDSSGNVGIGTSSPASLLHLESDTPVITLRDTSAYSAGTGPFIQFQGLDSGSTNRVFGQIYGLSNGSNSGELAFYTRNSGSTAERMRITTAGSVGIGTSSPSELLEVNSTGASTAIEISAGLASATTGEAKLVLRSLHSSSGTEYSRSEIASLGVAGGDSDLIFRTTTDASGPVEHMRIDSEGLVGIGTSSPAFLLDVRGNVSSNYLAYFKNDGNNSNRYGVLIAAGADSGSGTLMGFTDGDGTGVGGITFSGGTVTYGAFTAQHPCIIPDADNDPDSDSPAYPYGTLLETTSLSYTPKSDGTDSERGIRYHVRKTQTANSKAVLGAYGCSMNGGPENQTNEHQALVLGDGHILCNNSGGNIEMGDGICSSAVVGIGQKATASPSMIIGIAQEAVTFSSDTETKLVAVQYGLQQFTPW